MDMASAQAQGSAQRGQRHRGPVRGTTSSTWDEDDPTVEGDTPAAGCLSPSPVGGEALQVGLAVCPWRVLKSALPGQRFPAGCAEKYQTGFRTGPGRSPRLLRALRRDGHAARRRERSSTSTGSWLQPGRCTCWSSSRPQAPGEWRRC